MTDQELDDYIANAKRKSEETGLPIIRQDSVMAPAYKPKQEESILPALGGALGGIAGGLLIKNPMLGQTAGRAFVGSLIPSLAGSTAGTVAGTALERGIVGDLVSQEGAKQLIGNVLENAAWDVGGNLVFSAAGKTYRIGKDILSKVGVSKQGGLLGSEMDATKAAQEFLSKRGGTLTMGQIEGTPGLQAMEAVLKGGSGAGEFVKQQKGVKTALQQGIDEVLSTLDVSPAFAQAMKEDEPLKMAAGENFQNLISTARSEFKDTYRPFYNSLSQDLGVYVDMRPVKQKAKEELLRIEKIKGAGASADRKEVLTQILNQEDFLDFGAAHDLRSGFGGAANDLTMPGKNATSKEAAYRAYEDEVSKEMKKSFQLAYSTQGQYDTLMQRGLQGVEQPQAGTTLGSGFNPPKERTALSKELMQEYEKVTQAYKTGMQGLYNGTITAAMKASPSKVGAYLADLTEPEKFKDLYKAVAEIDRYATKETSKNALNDLKYTFLSDTLGTPEKAYKFAQNLKQDEDLTKAFYRMFRSEASAIKQVLNAADLGLQANTGARYYLDNRLAGLTYQGTMGIIGYLALPNNVQERLKDNLPEAALSAGALLITPKLLAKAATNKEAMDALVGLSKYKEGNKIGGAMAAKLASQLTKAGIIDSDYVSSVNSVFNAPKEKVVSEPLTSETGILTPEQLDEYIRSRSR